MAAPAEEIASRIEARLAELRARLAEEPQIEAALRALGDGDGRAPAAADDGPPARPTAAAPGPVADDPAPAAPDAESDEDDGRNAEHDRVVALVGRRPMIGARELAQAAGLGPTVARRLVDELVARGRLTRSGDSLLAAPVRRDR
jgi:hypothetical protein